MALGIFDAEKSVHGIREYLARISSGEGGLHYHNEVMEFIGKILMADDNNCAQDIKTRLDAVSDWGSRSQYFLGWKDVLKNFPLYSDNVDVFKYIVDKNERRSQHLCTMMDCDTFVTVDEILEKCGRRSQLYFYLQQMREDGKESFGVKLDLE